MHCGDMTSQSIPINELAQLQNKIFRELRRIHGSENIPQNLTIGFGREKVDVFRKLSLLHSKLRDIKSTVKSPSIERQTSIERALLNISASRSITRRSDFQTQMNATEGAIPLCIPNNYRWEPLQCKLVRQDVARSGLKPCEEGLRLLRAINGPVCVVCVVGPARSGKSYLLSQLQGSSFRLGHTMRAETMGIWIGSKPVEHPLCSGEKVTVVFLDSEGIGAVDSESTTEATDNQIFTLSVLISSLLIYNSKNVPKNTDLEKLHFVSKLSESIRVRRHAENTAEDVAQFKKCSPEFFWLIRDVTLEITDVNDQPCDIKTYLEQKVLKEEGLLSQSAKKKNEIRKNIKSFFQSIDAFTLPLPSDKRDVLKQMSNPDFKDKLSKDFLNQLEELKLLMTGKYQPKKGLTDSTLTGSQLADMVENYVNALNTKGYVPDWQSAWDMTVKMAYQRAGESAFEMYQALMSSLLSSFPCDEAEIMFEHEMCLKDAIQLFREETLMDPDVQQFKEYLKEFTKRCVSYQDNGECDDGLLFTYMKRNRELSDQFCGDMLQALVEQDLEPVLQNIDHTTSYEYILFVVREIETKYWECALGPSAGDVYQRYLTKLEERKRQTMRTISQLEDYNNEMEKEKFEKARIQQACQETEQENNRLERQREARAKQHLDEIQAIKEANGLQMRQLKEDREKAMENQAKELKEQHVANMNHLRNENRNMEEARNQKIRELERAQADLDHQVQAAKQEVQALKTRAPVVIRKKSGICSVM